MGIFLLKPGAGSDPEVESMLAKGGITSVQSFATTEALLDALGINPGASATTYFASVDLFMLDGISQLKDFEVIGAIRRNFRYQDVPIIILSDTRESELIQMMFAFGANDCIARPFDQVELIARVRSCLRLKHEIDRRQARERELTEVSKQLAELNSWLARLSLLDGLTRVSNRRAFDDTLLQEWKRSIRNKSPLTLLMVDVDYFKQYNDAFGHQAGDECLKTVASTIKNALSRPADFLCRYGGDEFAVLLPDTNTLGARKVAEKIRAAIETVHVPQATTTPKPFVTLTIGGVSWYPRLNDKPEDFLGSADAGLLRAKAEGRNCIEVLEAPESSQDRLKDVG